MAMSLSGRWERNQRLSCGGRAMVGLTARTSMNMRAALRELFLKEGAEVPPENGSVIAEIEAFSMEKISDGLFSFVCREESGETLTQLVSVRSQSAGGTGHE